jgi:hypothetical protein
MTWFNEDKIEELKSKRISELRTACKRLVNIGEWDFKYSAGLYGSQTYHLYWYNKPITLVRCHVYYPTLTHLYKNKASISGLNSYKIDGGVEYAVKILKRHAHRFLKLTENGI